MPKFKSARHTNIGELFSELTGPKKSIPLLDLSYAVRQNLINKGVDLSELEQSCIDWASYESINNSLRKAANLYSALLSTTEEDIQSNTTPELFSEDFEQLQQLRKLITSIVTDLKEGSFQKECSQCESKRTCSESMYQLYADQKCESRNLSSEDNLPAWHSQFTQNFDA